MRALRCKALFSNKVGLYKGIVSYEAWPGDLTLRLFRSSLVDARTWMSTIFIVAKTTFLGNAFCDEEATFDWRVIRCKALYSFSSRTVSQRSRTLPGRGGQSDEFVPPVLLLNGTRLNLVDFPIDTCLMTKTPPPPGPL